MMEVAQFVYTICKSTTNKIGMFLMTRRPKRQRVSSVKKTLDIMMLPFGIRFQLFSVLYCVHACNLF